MIKIKSALVRQPHHTVNLSQKISYAHKTTLVHIFITTDSYV